MLYLISIFHITFNHNGHTSSQQTRKPLPSSVSISLTCFSAHSRVSNHSSKPTSLHNRPSLRNKHPRMALHPHRPPRYPLPQRPILGHPPLSSYVPFRAPCDPYAHPLRPIPAFHKVMLEHIGFPPQELQSSVGGVDDLNRIDEFHDK